MDLSPAQIEASQRVMFNVQGERAFFYEREAGRAIMQMKVVKPKRTPPFRLARHPSDTTQNRQPLFEDMQPYSADALEAAIESRTDTTFHRQDLDQVEADLRERKLQAHQIMKGHRTVRRYKLKLPKQDAKQAAGTGIYIRSVSADVERLRLFAEAFEKETGLSLPYHGEELPTLMKRLVDEHLYWRRPCIPKEVREELRQRQGDKCRKCDDKLDGKLSLIHI